MKMENYSLSSCFSLVGKGSLSKLLSSFCGVLGIDPGVWCILHKHSYWLYSQIYSTVRGVGGGVGWGHRLVKLFRQALNLQSSCLSLPDS